jgi:transposase
MAGAVSNPSYMPERWDHLSILAGVCREIGLAEWLDAQDEHTNERVSVGAGTVAMILNGLDFSNRRLYLVPQFFVTKPLDHLLGPGITAEGLSADLLGRALDWLYAHDPTTLFAGIAVRARQRFGIRTQQVRVDTTPFSVSGACTPEALGEAATDRADATPDHLDATVSCEVDEAQLARAMERAASFIVATNVLDRVQLADEELIAIYKDQHSVERGFAFLKAPLFLASSVFLKKPERIMALSLVLVLCKLVYRRAEQRLREQLAATGQTIPDQVRKPTNRPTICCAFQCCEGVKLLHIRHEPDVVTSLFLRLVPLHQQILALLGPIFKPFYESSN